MKTSTLLPFFLWMLLTVSPATAAKTNVVYIMADELGYYETSYMGSKTIQTPRIDQLARQGIQFTQGLAGSAVCAPTRCSYRAIKLASALIHTRRESNSVAVRKSYCCIAIYTADNYCGAAYILP